MLHVRAGESSIRILFGINRNVPDPVPLGTLLIGKFIKDIFSSERKIVQLNSSAVPIFTVQKLETDKIGAVQGGSVANKIPV